MEKRNTNNVIISCCLSGAGTSRAMAPAVPIHPDEIAADVVKVVKAGAAIVHIHVRNDDETKSMSLDKFTEAVELTREACKKEDLDVIINLTDALSPPNLTVWANCTFMQVPMDLLQY